MKHRPRSVLAISSSGGHWAQLMRLRPAWKPWRTTYATVDPRLSKDVPGCDFYRVPDGNISTKIAVIRMAVRVFVLVARLRPSAVITTGAAPGFFGVLFGKLFGAKTVWIDSIANAEVLSVSGRMARRFSDVWLTQWSSLAHNSGPAFHGSVL